MPHQDDIVATAQLRLDGDTQAHVRDAAQHLLSLYTARPASGFLERMSCRRVCLAPGAVRIERCLVTPRLLTKSVNTGRIDTRCLDKQRRWQRINTPQSTLGELNKHRALHLAHHDEDTDAHAKRRKKLEPIHPQPHSATLQHDLGRGDTFDLVDMVGHDYHHHVLYHSSSSSATIHTKYSAPPLELRTNQARGIKTLSQRQASAHSTDTQEAHDGGYLEAIPLHEKRNKMRSSQRAGATAGRVSVSRGGGGPAHEWAQTFEFSQGQDGRMKDLHEVLDLNPSTIYNTTKLCACACACACACVHVCCVEQREEKRACARVRERVCLCYKDTDKCKRQDRQHRLLTCVV